MSYLHKRSIRDIELSGKRVIVRVDFNVPHKNSVISDDTRIRAALPTIKYLLEQKAAVILMSHLGRPKGKPNRLYTLRPVANRVDDRLKRTYIHCKDFIHKRFIRVPLRKCFPFVATGKGLDISGILCPREKIWIVI